MSRWTKREYDRFRADWLLERMAHRWSDGPPSCCTLCGAKYNLSNSRRKCPKRRKPNRWRVHFRRAVLQAQYPRPEPVKRTAAWMYAQLQEIRREVNRDPRFEDDRYWKYHRLARRYRRLMRDWWALPSAEVSRYIMHTDPGPDPFNAVMTRRRNKLLQQVRTTQARVIRDGSCTYTFHAGATWNGTPLFTEEIA